MTRQGLVLLLLVVLGTLAWWAVRASAGSNTVPMVPLTPARHVPLPPATGPVAPPVPTKADPGEPTARSAATLPGATPRAACIEVHVEQVQANTTRRLPGVDVALRAGDTLLWARTNASGQATFECVGGDGLVAQVSCALGATATSAMRADETAVVVLTIRPRTFVRGTVTDAAGQVIAGAAIVVLPWFSPGADAPAPSRIGTSNADGSYEVGLGVGGRIGAVHRVHGSSAMYSVPVSTGPTVTVPLVLLSLPGQVSGVVRGADGVPVAGAELEFRGAGKPPPGADLPAVPQRARSDEQGRYVVTRLLPGAISFGVRARGHGARQGSLQLEAGRASQCDIDLLPPCVLTGTVRCADDAPAAGAMVQVGADDTFLMVRTTTADDGTFRLQDLAPGQATLAASLPRPPGGPARRATAVRDLRADAPNEWHAVLSEDRGQGNLCGRLFAQTNGQRRALAGWRVVVRPKGGGQDVTVTAADGAFHFTLRPRVGPDLAPVRLRVDLRAYAPGKGVAGFADAVLLDVDASAGAVDFLVPTAVTGRLLARVVGADHTGVPATVECWHRERNERFRFQARDDGTVQRDDVPVGTIDVQFEHAGHASAVRSQLTITADTLLDLGEVVLGAGGTLFGSLNGPGGTVPEACELAVLVHGADGTNQRFLASYNAGTYRFPTLPAGAHSLLVQAPGLAARRFPVTIEAGVDKQQDVELLVGVMRPIRLVVPAGAPRVVGLALLVPGKDCCWIATQAVAGDPGADREVQFVAWMSPGAYEALAWAGAEWKAQLTVTFAAGLEDEVRLELRPK